MKINFINCLYLLALGTLSLVSCKKDEPAGLGQETDKAKILFVNSAPNAATDPDLAAREIAIFPYYNGVTFNNTPIKFSHPNGYKAFAPGNMTIRLDTAQSQGNDPPKAAEKVAEITFSTAADEYYSLFAIGTAQAVEAKLLRDDIKSVPPTGKARVRIMNFSPDAGPVDVVITAEAKGTTGTDPRLPLATPRVLASSLEFRGVKDFFEIDAGAYSIEIRDAGTGTTLFARPNSGPVANTQMIIDDRSYYSIWVAGFRTPPSVGTIGNPPTNGTRIDQRLALYYHANRWSNPFVR